MIRVGLPLVSVVALVAVAAVGIRIAMTGDPAPVQEAADETRVESAAVDAPDEGTQTEQASGTTGASTSYAPPAVADRTADLDRPLESAGPSPSAPDVAYDTGGDDAAAGGPLVEVPRAEDRGTGVAGSGEADTFDRFATAEPVRVRTETVRLPGPGQQATATAPASATAYAGSAAGETAVFDEVDGAGEPIESASLADGVAATPAGSPGADPVRTVTTNQWVNMRDAADSSSGVIRVVPYGAEVALVSCDGWCEVEHEGTRGFIYRNFLSGID